MPQVSFRDRSAIYNESRLGLSVPGRLLVRVGSAGALVLLGVVGIIGVLSDVPQLRGGGILALLFLGERLLYRSTSDKTLTSLARVTGLPNLAPALTPVAYKAVERAFDASRVTRQPLGLALLQQLLRDFSVKKALTRTEVDIDALAMPGEPLGASLSEEAVAALFSATVAAAADVAVAVGQNSIGPVALLAGLIASGDTDVARVAARARLERDDLGYAIQAAARDAQRIYAVPREVPHHVMNRAWTSRPTPALDSVSRDLTDFARLGLLPQLIGHTDAYETTLQTLAKTTHPHAMLIAPAAGGKETLVGEVARAIVAGTAPGPLLDRRLVRIDVAAMMAAGGSDPASLIKTVADEIIVAGNIVLYLPDFEHLAQASGAYVAAADVLLPILTADTFPVIAATTPEAYARILETRGDIAGTFQAVRLSALAIPDVVEVLARNAQQLERAHGVGVSITALRTAATLATRYLAPTRPVPGSALDLIAEAAVAARAAQSRTVTSADVERAIERQTHVPVGAVASAEADVLINLETTLKARVIGQDEAVSAAAEAVRAYRAGLMGDGAPASFLFVGPTGVGKTELAKALADAVYGADSFTRLDMSEFSEAGSVARLIGTSDMAGALTDPVRLAPHRLVLLDEFEKASPEAIRLLLQVLSDGRLTDGAGRTISFADAFIVATSNAKSEIVRDALRKGENVASIEGYLRERLSDVFPTELLNRFTRIVIFRDLVPDQLRVIAANTVAHISALLEARYGVTLEADKAALDQIVRTGYDPQWGARPLRRAAEAALDAVLAPQLLAGTVAWGTHVTVTFRDGIYAISN